MICDVCGLPATHYLPTVFGAPHRFCDPCYLDHQHGIAIMLDRLRERMPALRAFILGEGPRPPWFVGCDLDLAVEAQDEAEFRRVVNEFAARHA